MAISRSQMEEQIRGFAAGGAFDAGDIFREDEKDPFAIPAMPPGIATLPTAPTLTPPTVTPPTVDMSGFSLQEKPEEEDPFALPDLDELLRQADELPATSVEEEEKPETEFEFSRRMAEYKKRLGPLMAQSERPTLYDLAADLGAAMLAAPADQGPFASSAAGFVAFNKRLRKQREDKRKIDQAVGLKAFEMARQDEKAANDLINKKSLLAIELANKPAKMVMYAYDQIDPKTGEVKTVEVPVNEANRVALEAILELPNARIIPKSANTVNISEPSPSKFMQDRGQDLAESITTLEENREKGIEQQRLVNMMTVALSRLKPNEVGVIASSTLQARKFLDEIGIRTDDAKDNQELLAQLGTRIAMQLIGDTKGAITEMEMRLFIAASPGLASSPGGLLKQAEYLKRIADINIRLADDFYENKELQDVLADATVNDVYRNQVWNQWYANWRRENPFLEPDELAELRAFALKEPEAARSYRREFGTMDSVDMTKDY